MPHITIEYVILIPVLFAQILVFPLAATMMASSWAEVRRDAALQDAASNLASTIQQLYLSVNREEVEPGNITQASTLPQTIESYPYTVVGNLSATLDPNSSRVLTLTLSLEGSGNTVTSIALVGPNVEWDGGTFRSNSPNASIKVEKKPDDTIHFSFE